MKLRKAIALIALSAVAVSLAPVGALAGAGAPAFVYVKSFAGSAGRKVAVDSSGAIYLAIQTNGVVAGTLTGVRVVKLAPDATTVLYTKDLNGSADEDVTDIAVDALGSAYVIGQTFSSDFPTTAGAFDTSYDGAGDGFAAKLSPDGATIVYSTYLGGTAADIANGADVTASGDLVIAGTTASGDFPTTPGAFHTAINGGASQAGNRDAFVLRLGASGAAPVYSTFLGDIGSDYGNDVALDADEEPYVCGSPGANSFPVTPGALHEDRRQFVDLFVSKLSSDGSSLLISALRADTASTYIGLDPAGNVYVAGEFSYPRTRQAQVTRLNATLSAATYDLKSPSVTPTGIGPSGMVVDADGTVYFSGTIGLTGATVATPGAYDTHIDGDYDAIFAQIPPDGSGFSYLTFLGGTSSEYGGGIAKLGPGRMVFVGTSYSTDFPPSPRAGNVFLARFDAPVSDTIGVNGGASNDWFLHATNTYGAADFVFGYGGSSGFVPLAGDWDGSGSSTAGLYDTTTGAFFLRNGAGGGLADVSFTYGGGNQVPIVGDWDGNGTDTIALYEPATGRFLLRNANSPGPADVVFYFGAGGLGYIPVAGDWNHDGADTIGLYDPAAGAFFLKNANASGAADLVFTFGAGGASTPVVGDWNHDGTDTIGIYQPASATLFLRDTNANGAADYAFQYGPANSKPLAGRWSN